MNSTIGPYLPSLPNLPFYSDNFGLKDELKVFAATALSLIGTVKFISGPPKLYVGTAIEMFGGAYLILGAVKIVSDYAASFFNTSPKAKPSAPEKSQDAINQELMDEIKSLKEQLAAMKADGTITVSPDNADLITIVNGLKESQQRLTDKMSKLLQLQGTIEERIDALEKEAGGS